MVGEGESKGEGGELARPTSDVVVATGGFIRIGETDFEDVEVDLEEPPLAAADGGPATCLLTETFDFLDFSALARSAC